MSHWIDRRRSGVLLHITSLPGAMPNGVLGEKAHQFMDNLAEGGFSVWQFLPLGPTHGHGSPYESLSSFAGNVELLDLHEFVRRDWLTDSAYQSVTRGRLSPAAARAKAAAKFWAQVKHDSSLAEDMRRFHEENADWLDDYALFAAVKQVCNDIAWWEWPEPLRKRKPEALALARTEHADLIRQVQFEQLMFERQWQALKDHAEARGVLLFGDLPIYVAHDSADVWANQQLFTINDAGLCEEVAGVPPDLFSKTGQRWGNPLYRWDRLEAEDFDWWVKRLQAQLKRMHLLRIDHFCGLKRYWAIPAEWQDGRVGKWYPGPGEKLLGRLKARLGKLPLIAEDLGLLIKEVRPLRERFGLPGMKVLQFAFSGDDSNPFLPHHHEEDSVAYTGTHDNDTTLGWFQSESKSIRNRVSEYLNADTSDMPWPMIHATLGSVARLAIIPMQDLLSLDSRARLNTPGTIEGSWDWRLNKSQLTSNVWAKARELNRRYRR